MNNLKFEDKLPEINRIVSLHIHKWKLAGAIPSISKEDISQEVVIHIFEKWHLYDPARPLGNWLTTVVCNCLINLQRNNYYKFSKPCVALKCAAYLGGEDCKLYIKTCSDCPLYAKWERDKKQQHDIKLPLSIENENRMQKLSETPHEESNIFEKLDELKFKLKDKLTSNEFYIFNALYLENKNELQILSELEFSSKTQGLKEIKNLKNNIFAIVKKILINEELF